MAHNEREGMPVGLPELEQRLGAGAKNRNGACCFVRHDVQRIGLNGPNGEKPGARHEYRVNSIAHEFFHVGLGAGGDKLARGCSSSGSPTGIPSRSLCARSY